MLEITLLRELRRKILTETDALELELIKDRLRILLQSEYESTARHPPIKVKPN